MVVEIIFSRFQEARKDSMPAKCSRSLGEVCLRLKKSLLEFMNDALHFHHLGYLIRTQKLPERKIIFLLECFDKNILLYM